ncbi:GxGYxYP domain-containing protein [uncultured Desulfobulbus sp.]|uniref:GxGYxYP domain-containing protein n=1 Tax=uncultured Desulfobulbus sp. TaxID=239745 RepID=UPI0029C7D7F3|nr:GxGYxYP domain-containing protein [uncultured Desulfobulbus sp.]
MYKGIIRLLGLTIVIQALFILPAMCGSAQTQKGGKPIVYIYNIVKQPANADDYDEIAALASMQGIINRDRAILYINNDRYGRPKYWLDIMSKDGRWLEGREHKSLTSLDAVYKLAAGKLKGAVIWDPDVPATINVATTIAGVEDAVIFSPSMADKYLKKWNLKVIKDLRGMFTGKETGSKKNDAYRWAIREYVDKGKCSPHFLCLYTDAFYDRKPGQLAYLIVRDWAVKNRAFTYDLSPWGDEVPADDPNQRLGTDLATYKMLLAATLKQSAGKQMTEVAGFFSFQKYANMPGHPSKHDPVPTEWETVYLISPYNCYQNTATEFSYNQSFHCHAPVKQLKQSRPVVKHKLENKSYIAILMADYDSAFPLYNFFPNNWDTKERGDLPLNWGINPNLIEAYPDIISYIYSTATPNDHFVADASAAGYFNPNRIQKKYLPLFVKHNQKFYKQTDMTISGMVLDWDQPSSDVKDAFSKFSPDGYATIVADMHGSGGRPPQPQVWKGMPIVNLLGADPNSPEYTAGEIYNAVKKRKKDEPGFYDFRCVWVTPAQVKASLDLFAKQHPEEQFEVVDIYTFFDLFKRYNEKWISDNQVITTLPASSAFLEGYSSRFDTHYTIQNVTSKPMKAVFTVTGLEDAVVTPANADLPPGKEVNVVISGNAVSDKITVEARGPFGLRQSVTKVRRVLNQEISGVIPKNTKLQFISDSGIDILPHNTGEQITNSDGSTSLEAKKGDSKPGFLAYGPYSSLNAGRYLALFRVKRTGEGSGDAAEADIVSGGHPIGASKMIKADELPIGEYKSVALIFDYNLPGSAYESRLSWTGNASLVFDRVIIWKIVE